MKTIGRDFGDTARKVYAVASGALGNGKAVVVNSDGTVSVVSQTSTTEAIGAEAVFEASAEPSNFAVVHDSNANRIVIAYKDAANSGYGTAVVGTVTAANNSISFGTPVVFESANSLGTSAVYEANAQKIVIAYRDQGNSGRGTAIVGTVDNSDNSISFGSASVFETGTTNYINTAFDSSNNKVVISFQDASDSYGKARVATVSGTSISFGSVVTILSAASVGGALGFDSNSNKIVVAYANNSSSGRGAARVGTVSGTDISFGTEVVFLNSNTADKMGIAFDTENNKIVIAYSNNGAGKGIVGTVSGTDISFGSEVTFQSSGIAHVSAAYASEAKKILFLFSRAADGERSRIVTGEVSGTSISNISSPFNVSVDTKSASPRFTYDTTANKAVIAFFDETNSSYGTSTVYQPSFLSTPLTSENFLGFTNAAYATGQTATIQAGGAVNTGQSSLTAGQQYFVQGDGTIGTTAASPSVIAGTAVSATDLIVKG